MKAPTKDQVFAFARHIGTSAATVIGTLAAMKVISGGDAQQMQGAIDSISHGTAEVVAGLSTLAVAATGLIAALSASPLVQLFKGAKAVMADPEKVADLQTASISDKSCVAAAVDKMPEVAGVALMPTPAGQKLAMAVPSESVQIAANSAVA